MTLDDYKAFVKEYKETDSISRRDEIEHKLYVELIALTKSLEDLYNKYGTSFIDDDEWRDDRGGYTLSKFYEDQAYLQYYDSWSYGGECVVGIVIPTKFFNIEERNKKEEELKERYIKRLKQRITDIDSDIEKLQKDKEEIISKLETYGHV